MEQSAASAAASESHNSSGQQGEAGAEEESQGQQGGSVNWGQATAQSPRVPRSQISRAHAAPAAAGYGERNSGVLSALSGDDETALSAAEAAGEHTSEPQEAVGGVGEVQRVAQNLGGGGAAAAAPQHPHHLQQQLPALSLTAPAPRGRGFELASSPPASTSPIYRANSVVSYTAGPPRQQAQQAQGVPAPRRGGETPASAPAAAQMLGTSPNTSRGEFSAAIPRAPRRAGAFSAGLPPTLGHRPGSAQHAAALAGPSRPSMSGTQSHAVGAAVPALSLPSTMAMALGALTPQGGALLGQLSAQQGGLALPTPPSPGSASLAGLLPLAASMGLQPSQLGTMAAALLQAQSSALGLQQQQQSAHGQQQVEQPAASGQQQQQQGVSLNMAAMPPPPPQLQVFQQAEALQSMAAMLQAQASAIMNGTPAMQQQDEHAGGPVAAMPASAMLSPAAAMQQQQQQHEGGALPVTSEAGQAHPAASQGAASVQSLPSLVGASAIQGHPLPPPAWHRGAGAGTPVPLRSFGGTPAPPMAAMVAPHTGQSGAFPAPGPLAGPATALQVAAAASEMQGSAVQPAIAALLQQATHPEALAAGGPDAQAVALAAPMLQAASAVQGSGNGGFGSGGSGSQQQQPSFADPGQAAAEAERRRHALDPPQPQAATIEELPTADVAAASQGGGMHGDGQPVPQHDLPPAVPQEAAMLGGNSAFGDAMELGAEDEDAMEVQQEAAGGMRHGQLPPAPHGAASVMATLMTDNGGGEQSEGDAQMEQQAASGPSRSAAAVAQPAESLSHSMAEPAAATAHVTGAPSAHTAPSQRGPATSNHGQVGHALSSLATVSTGNGERAGGSVEMSALPSQQQEQHATSAPAVIPGGPGAPPLATGVAGGAGTQGQEALSPTPPLGLHASPPAYPAASAPATMPPQAAPGPGGGPAGVPSGRHEASASMSGQGDTPGMPLQYGTHGAAVAQSSIAAGPFAAFGGAAQHQQPQGQPPGHQQEGGFGGHGPYPAHPGPAPALASLCMGQNDGVEPMTDARSHRQRSMHPMPAPAPAPATIEGMGSPTASMHAGQPRESQGTARATILAGAAHSILTTAAAGEGEAMDEGGEALSPLLLFKGVHLHAHAAAGASQAQAAFARALAAVPGTGSVGGTPPPLAMQPAMGGGSCGAAGATTQPLANGHSKPCPSDHQQVQQQQQQQPGAGASSPAGSPGFASPIDLSTMAVDLGPAGNGTAHHPQPSVSGQPSHLPPPGAVAAALAALEQQQAGLNGSAMYAPPPAPAELGELYQTLMQQQNGYATHANSAIGNGHIAHSSPEREMTSPSRMLTHDSTGSGSRQRQQHSKQAAKRRRTSAGPSSSTQHA